MEVAATAAIIQGCVKGMKKISKAELQAFEKKHTWSVDKPSEKSTETRPPSNACNLKVPGPEKRACCNNVTTQPPSIRHPKWYGRGEGGHRLASIISWQLEPQMILASTLSYMQKTLARESLCQPWWTGLVLHLDFPITFLFLMSLAVSSSCFLDGGTSARNV